jgi:hypothetical protein
VSEADNQPTLPIHIGGITSAELDGLIRAAVNPPEPIRMTYGTNELGSWIVVNGEAEFGPFPSRETASAFMGSTDRPGWRPYAVNTTDLPDWFRPRSTAAKEPR